MDLSSYLRLKPGIEQSIATVDMEVSGAKLALDAAQANYDRLTTQAANLRVVLDMLNAINAK